MALTDEDIGRLERCVELAAEALAAGDEPFGSVLVDETGAILAEDRNRIAAGDPTAHPELALARWAVANLRVEKRSTATVYTSGEHCPMCAGAHGWAGLGRVVFAASSAQLTAWQAEWGTAPGPLAALPITAVAPGVPVDGPVPALAPAIKELYRAAFGPRR